jgi:hypothetical protein
VRHKSDQVIQDDRTLVAYRGGGGNDRCDGIDQAVLLDTTEYALFAQPKGESETMKAPVAILLMAFALQACSSAPKPPEPTGQWVPVNQPLAQQSGHAEPK